MKKETAKTRIANNINREYVNETQAVRDYLIDVILLTWENLELDYNACHDDGTPYTSTENVKYALSTIDSTLLDEARRETKILHKPQKGYFGVWFYDDNGKCKNHWLSENQTKFCKEREDAIAYIEEVKSWNAISFTQTLIYLVD